MQEKCSIIILAGGFGTRMKSKIPKVLHKICGKEMLFCLLDSTCELSDDICIVLFNEADKIIEAIDKNYPNHNFKFHIQDHNNYPGTAGALMQGRIKNATTPKAFIDVKYNKTIILCGDMPLVSKEKITEFIESSGDIAMGILELENASGYGRVVVNNGNIEAIIEEKDASDNQKQIKLANAGIYCFRSKILKDYIPKLESSNAQREFYLTDIIHLAFKNAMKILPIYGKECDFMGVNSKVDLSKAQNLMIEKLITQAMKNGVIFHLPQSIYIEFGTTFEGECEVESNIVFKGNNKIINSKILSNSVIEDSTINNSIIGPLAHIRPKCEIIDSHIGNFVEIKASKLNGVKAGHLSYLGDSEIDSGTNVGAGVITCNYDGISKHKTIIGKNVFIGSDSQLIAPLNIESNVLIASGSTMVKDAKDGDLVISRTRQENKSGFFYIFFGRKKS